MSVLFGTALLGLLGFTLGIVAGLVLDEPALLLDYVTGRTTTARLEREAAPVATAEPDVAAVRTVAAAPAAPDETATPPVAAPPPGAAPVPKAAAVEDVGGVAVPAETSAEPPAPAHSGQTGYSVQVGALADSASAEQLAAKLEKRGFSVYVAPSAEPSARRWRVRVGPVATREEAQRLAARLEQDKLPTWVLAEGRR